MNKRWYIPVIAVLLLAVWAGAASALAPFKISEYVTDRAGLLEPGTMQQLAAELNRYDQATGNQILVVTVPSLEGSDLVGFTESLFKLNQPGQKGKNNGLILLVAKQEKKVRIEVGYDLEGPVPDGKAGTIIRDEIRPRFQAGDFNGGITAGVIAIVQAISPDYSFGGPVPAPVRRGRDKSFPAAFIVAMIIFALASIFGNRGNQATRRRYSRGYSEPGYWGGGGGWSGGGSSGGGGGGFSGGGGSFGGGGASGDW